MKFKIDGSYVNGTDIGHPDGVDIFTACCCGFVAGDTSEKRDANARLVVAAPEMYEALQMFLAYNDQGGPIHFDTDAMWAKARSVIAKIEGGGDE